jgi:hypothetical protein
LRQQKGRDLARRAAARSTFAALVVSALALAEAGCSDGSDGAATSGSSTGGSATGGAAQSGGATTGGSSTGGAATSGGVGSSGCAQRELFTNGNFEAGDTAWSASSANWPALIVSAEMAGGTTLPQAGTHFARLGGYAKTDGQDNLIAQVSVPESATKLIFSFYSIVTTTETSTERRDQLFLSLDSDVQYVEEVLDNTAVHAQWQRYEKAIDPQAAGKTLILVIRAENDALNATTFLLDSLSLTATVCP